MNETLERGEHKEFWDGNLDSGKKAAPGTYTIKLGYNNVEYQWEGLIGNTESSWSSFPAGMAWCRHLSAPWHSLTGRRMLPTATTRVVMPPRFLMRSLRMLSHSADQSDL